VVFKAVKQENPYFAYR